MIKYNCLFSEGENNVGFNDRLTHDIQLNDETPIKQPYRCIPKAVFNELIDRL